MKFFPKVLILFLFISFLSFCKNQTNKIPYVYVDFTIDLDKPEFFELNTIGNYIYVTGGVSGIIVYRDSRDVFFAYDRACPYDPECGRLIVDENGYRVTDTACCHSVFSLTFDGAIISGPAKMSLRKYKTYFYPHSNSVRVISQ